MASKINMGETQNGWLLFLQFVILRIGIPLYGRSFGNTAGLGQPFDRVNKRAFRDPCTGYQ